jgi:hypothetical protein
MIQRLLRFGWLMVALLTLFAAPARAHTMTVNITATCACDYSVEITGNTFSGAGSVTVFYSFQVTTNGGTFTVKKSVDVTADNTGSFSATITGIPLPTTCGDTISFSNGYASLSFNGGPIESGFTINLPDTLYCNQPPPPEGKTFDIGPSSMEGHLLMRPGDWISGGYSFKFVNGSHAASTVTVTSTLTMPFKCSNGSAGQFTLALGTQNIAVPAGNTAWQPTGDANSVLSWAGSVQAPDGCGNGTVMDNSKGAIFEATVSQNPDTGSLLNWRFKYRDPNAKGKGNVNCLDTSDPRRAKADVCGASWSQTVTDP